MILNVNIIFMEPHRDETSYEGRFVDIVWKSYNSSPHLETSLQSYVSSSEIDAE